MNNGYGTEDLRQYLAEHLPETMLPSAFVELDQLPRTLERKIRSQGATALEAVQAQRDKVTRRPHTPIEEIVAGIWCEVLRLPASDGTTISSISEAIRCW